MKRLVCVFTALAMTACASVHGGAETGETADPLPNLRYSLKKVDVLSDEVHTFVAVTIENRSNNWVRVRSVELTSPEPDRYPYNIIAGEDLETWAESAETKIAMSRHNTDVAMFAAALTGLATMAIAATRGDATGVTLGAATAAGASVAHDTIGLSARRTILKTRNTFPKNISCARSRSRRGVSPNAGCSSTRRKDTASRAPICASKPRAEKPSS